MRFHISPGPLPVSGPADRTEIAGIIARLIASEAATSKAEIGRATGLSRTTVDQGLALLVRLRAVRSAGPQPRNPGRGRTGDMLALVPGYRAILVADCGVTNARLAVVDMDRRLRVERDLPIRIDQDPDTTLARISESLLEMIHSGGLDESPRRLVLGLPGVIDKVRGRIVHPPGFGSWEGIPIVDRMSTLIDGPTQLRNETNLRALGEARAHPTQRGPLVYLKVGTGIGLAAVSVDGELLTGANGAAGQIAHTRVPGSTSPCVCGRVGCLQAEASASAVASALGLDTRGESWTSEIAMRLRSHDPQAVAEIARAAEAIGELLVGVVGTLNPERIVVGGSLATASDHLLAGVRSVVYAHALPFATRDLIVREPALGARSGTVGAVAVAIDSEFSSATIEDELVALDARERASHSAIAVGSGRTRR